MEEWFNNPVESLAEDTAKLENFCGMASVKKVKQRE